MSTSVGMWLLGRTTEKAACITGNSLEGKSNSSSVNNNGKTKNNY